MDVVSFIELDNPGLVPEKCIKYKTPTAISRTMFRTSERFFMELVGFK
jgi:hypothetical protein